MLALWNKIICFLLGISCVASPITPVQPSIQTTQNITLGAANTKIRQEINITNDYLTAASGALATSSARVLLTDNYTGPTYYFEVLASTTAATNAKVTLQNATSSKMIASVTINGTAPALYRSTAFVPTASSTEYVVAIQGEAVGKSVAAARIIVLQDSGAGDLTNTETQIEVGCRETYTSISTTTCSAPKYWYYDSTKWDGSLTFYAEVTYENTAQVTLATTTNIWRTAGTYNVVASTTYADMSAWGGGGAGFDGSNSGGGAGGGGGAFASSSVTFTLGTTTTFTVGVGGSSSGANGATTTAIADSATVIAANGYGGGGDVSPIGRGGLASASTGTVKNNGGNGGQGRNGTGGGATDEGGGGGGAGGSEGAGNVGQDGQSGAGGSGGQGAGTAGGAGGSSPGGAGTSNTKGGGGGAGGVNAGTGGNGGAPGAGGGGGEAGQGNGAAGAVMLTFKPQIVASTTISLEMSDGTGDGFQGWTPIAQIVKGSDFAVSTSTRARSAAFVPTSGRNYRIAFREGYNGATHAIYNAKIVVSQTAVTSIDDFYNNSDGSQAICVAATCTFEGIAQTFTSAGGTLANAKFVLQKAGSPTGNVSARIYDITGTYGTDSRPTGSALATSDTIDVSTLPTSFSTTTFTFSGAEQITLIAASNYAVTFEYNGGGGASWVNVRQHSASPTHSGNLSRFTTSWSGDSSRDLAFEINTFVNPTKLQPQYLLAPKTLASGTGLQNYLTSWNSAEWSTTNRYILQAEAANGDTSVVELDTAAGAQVSGSVISTIDNRATSTAMCFSQLANGNVDTKATTNSGNIYAVRILVDVGSSQAEVCPAAASVSVPKVQINTQTIIQGRVLVQ